MKLRVRLVVDHSAIIFERDLIIGPKPDSSVVLQVDPYPVPYKKLGELFATAERVTLDVQMIDRRSKIA